MNYHRTRSGTVYATPASGVPDGCEAVVVICPEDREQVERLGKALFDNAFIATGRLSDALREFANPTPPKPPEPTGLGAVVEDAEGVRWVRTADTDCVDPWNRAHNYQSEKYANIHAVRILSEGVTP